MHKAILEHGFGDDAGTFGDGVHGHELRLHVRGKRRIRCGAHVHGLGAASLHIEADPVVAGFYRRPGLAQFIQHRLQQVGLGIAHLYAAAGHGRCHQVRTGFNAVGNDVVAAAAQAFDAFDGNHVAARAYDAGAHAIETTGQVRHFRFARGIFNHRDAVRQGRGHHQVFGAGDRHHVHKNARTLKTFGARLDIAVFDDDLRTHGLQALDMQIDRA